MVVIQRPSFTFKKKRKEEDLLDDLKKTKKHVIFILY